MKQRNWRGDIPLEEYACAKSGVDIKVSQLLQTKRHLITLSAGR